jgi:hypothetical protein
MVPPTKALSQLKKMSDEELEKEFIKKARYISALGGYYAIRASMKFLTDKDTLCLKEKFFALVRKNK